ncbi:MAG: pentapeptide repeat-containing protein [Magnetococcales bacterium]|nr:pentapeptide repeat-containing protein [Magnetococcales bacterium]
MNQTPTANRPLSRQETLELLQKILPGLRPDFREKVILYTQLLERHTEETLPLATLLDQLYPGLPASDAMTRFRNNFKKNLNQHLKSRQSQLCSQTDNRPVAEKRVWLTSTAPRIYDPEIMKRVESEAHRIHRDTPPEHYILQAAITDHIPFLSFPQQVERFARHADAATWEGLGEELQRFFARLGAKLDPILQARPRFTGSLPLVGFELLGIGPNGESFPRVLELARLPEHLAQTPPLTDLEKKRQLLVKFILAVVGVETARFLLDQARYQGIKNFTQLRFTLNLDREMLHSHLLLRFLDRYGDYFKEQILVEVNEDLQPDEGDAIRALVQREQLSIVLDDLNEWHDNPRVTLESLALWTKVSHKLFQPLAQKIDHHLDEVIRTLERHSLDGKPLVVEGVEKEEHLRLLTQHWRKGDPLYVQGHWLEPNPDWKQWLVSLKEFPPEKKGGGFILVPNPLYAGMMQTLHTQLPAEVLARMKCHFKQGWMDCELPHAEAKPLRLLVPTSSEPDWQEIPSTNREQGILIIDHLQEEFDQSRQCDLKKLPELLAVWRLGAQVSRNSHTRAGRQEVYDDTRWIIPRAREILEEREVENPNALNLLIHWLEEPNRPFCAVLGDLGMGKTFLCRMFTRLVHERRNAKENPIRAPLPIYLDMRDVPWESGKVPKLEKMLEELLLRAQMKDLPVEGVLAMVQAGHLCLIFDGFDEKAAAMSAKDGNFLLKEMRRAAPAGSQGKVLITSRTHYFLNRRDEEVRIGGGARRGLTRDGFRTEELRLLYLLPFDEERIREYLERILPGQGERTLTLFKEVHDLLDLATRPYLLQLITDSLEWIRRRARPGTKVTAGDIYEGVVEHWLERDREKMGILSYTIPPAMEAMARLLWERERQSCPHQQIFEWQMAHARTLSLDSPVPGFEELHERLNTLLRTASFLSRDGEGNYRFAHTSFLEFFLARTLNKELAEGRGEALALNPLSQEAMRFLLDLQDPSGPGKVTASITRILEGAYIPRGSENALRLALLWQRERPESAPRPKAWHLPGGRLEGMDLSHIQLEGVDLTDAHLSRANLTGARLRGTLHKADLRHLQAPGVNLSGCDLSGCDLTAANLAGADLSHSRLEGATLTSSFLQRANLRGALLVHAKLARTRLAWAELEENRLSGTSLDACSRWDRPAAVSLSTFSPCLQSGHGDGIRAVAFSPDGNTLLSGSNDHTLKLWDPHSRQCIQTLKGHEGSVRAVAFSPDGNTILSGSLDHTLKLWDPHSGQCIQTLKGHEGSVNAIAFSPDGNTLLSESHDHTLKLWDTRSGQCIQTFKGHKKSVHAVAFSPDGKSLLSGSNDHTLKLWDPRSGQCIQTFKGHKNSVRAVAFSPDGNTLLSGSDDHTLKLWDTRSRQCTQTLQGHEDPVHAVAFSPDGKSFLSGSSDDTLKLWDPLSGQCILTLKGHDYWVKAIAFSPDGNTILSGSLDHTLKLWDPHSGQCIQTLKGHEDSVLAVAFSPDGKSFLSSSFDKTLKLWDPHSGQCTQILQGHEASIRAVAFSPDGKSFLSGSLDKTLKLWDTLSGKCTQTLQGHEAPVLAVAFSPDGKSFLSGCFDHTLKLWDTRSRQCIHTLQGHEDSVRAVAFSPDGKSFLSGSFDHTLKLWDPLSGKCTQTLQGHEDFVLAVAFSPDGKSFLSGSDDHTLKLWDPLSGKYTQTLQGHKAPVQAVAFSPDGKSIVSGSDDNTLKLWNPLSGKCIQTLQGHEDWVRAVAFSPDGRRIISAGENIRIWDAATGQEMAALWGWADGGYVVLLPDGRVGACNPAGLARVGFVHQGCVYPGEEFTGCFPTALPEGRL